MKLTNCILSLFTCLVLICGLALVGVGGFVLANMYAYSQVMDSNLMYAMAGVMGLGAVVALINFFGCYGACTRSSKMVKAFLALKVLALVIEVAVVVLALIYKDNIKDVASKVLTKGLDNYNQPGHDFDATEFYDNLQHELQCCGVEGPQDWSKTPFGQGKNVPDTCCHAVFKGCGDNALTSAASKNDPIFEDGCLKKVTDTVTQYGVYVIGAVVVIIFLECLTALLACVVYSRTKASVTV